MFENACTKRAKAEGAGIDKLITRGMINALNERAIAHQEKGMSLNLAALARHNLSSILEEVSSMYRECTKTLAPIY